MQEPVVIPNPGENGPSGDGHHPEPHSQPDWSALAARLQLDSPQPLYRRVSSHIETWIECGDLRPGNQLASERHMTELLKVSRRTVRAALADLIERGYVVATHGRGNFVVEPPNRRELRFLGLERFDPQRGSMSPFHYDLVHNAEAEIGATVHYKYAPTIEQLLSILASPPSGYQGILILRPTQEWLDALLSMQNQLEQESSIPLLIVSRDLSQSCLNFVSPDHFGQTHSATTQLVEAGHKRIAYISGSRSISYLETAFNGYTQAMQEACMSQTRGASNHWIFRSSPTIWFLFFRTGNLPR